MVPLSKSLSVGVVICSYTLERWDLLCRAAAGIGRQTFVPHEFVIVVDHNPELGRQLQHLPFAGCRVVPNSQSQGLSGARNTGVQSITSDVIAFLDDDAIPEAEWLEHLMAPLDDDTVIGVGGWVEPAWRRAPPSWWPPTFNWVVGCSYVGLPGDLAPIRNPIGASMAIRRQAILDAGGFSTGLGRVGTLPVGCEETELALRIVALHPGKRFVHATASRVHHFVPSERASLRYFLRRCAGEGVSKAHVARLVNTPSSLHSEWAYVRRAIPKALAEDSRRLVRDLGSGLRAGALLLGLATTAGAYAVERARLVFRRRLLASF